MTFKLKLCTLLALLITSFNLYAQVRILDPKKLSKIKEGKTYIMVQSTKFPGAEQFLEQAKQNWTLSKGIDYIAADHQSTLNPNDSFLSLQALTETRGGMISVYYALSLWTCKEKYFSSNRSLRNSDHEPVAEIAISVDPKAMDAHVFFKRYDFDGGGLLYNWSPGMLKNYLGQMTRLLNTGKKVQIQDDIVNKAELAKLSAQTLYVPDFNLIRFHPFVLGTKKVADEENLFEDYKYPYKVVSKADLDKIIIEGDQPAYYLVFIKDSSSKIVCVINSKTGETIYSTAKAIAYNLKSGDLKDLYKEIIKSSK
ncbi:hypothetical protein [Pedobacter aquatilis]|uniref:hypothetical protein n=1 Tax=Pedobacter aquatilis TaxID=351343 RepID=UPI0029307FCC|nr:hypothetical protein [Pedobacter aquatilis]